MKEFDIIIEGDDDLEMIFEEVKRKIPTKIKRVIKTRSGRNTLKEKCGDKAFLMPEKMKFPIYDPETCKPDCRLLLAAYTRARQWSGKKPHYREIASRAKELMKRNGCSSKIGITVENVGIVPLEEFLDAILLLDED
ncbi:MAG: hypothetical protein QXD03_02090 [Candidatus Anstonellales archaeon]